jgi:hypothetical protein
MERAKRQQEVELARARARARARAAEEQASEGKPWERFRDQRASQSREAALQAEFENRLAELMRAGGTREASERPDNALQHLAKTKGDVLARALLA